MVHFNLSSYILQASPFFSFFFFICPSSIMHGFAVCSSYLVKLYIDLVVTSVLPQTHTTHDSAHHPAVTVNRIAISPGFGGVFES